MLLLPILGPERKVNQVEISATEARTLGIKAPVRESGDVKGSAPITIKNPENGKEIQLTEGCIIAKRHIHMTPEDAANFKVNNHIHMTPEDAANFKVNNGDIVWVKVMTNDRSIVFGDTVIRVSPKYKLAMHIFTKI